MFRLLAESSRFCRLFLILFLKLKAIPRDGAKYTETEVCNINATHSEQMTFRSPFFRWTPVLGRVIKPVDVGCRVI